MTFDFAELNELGLCKRREPLMIHDKACDLVMGQALLLLAPTICAS